MPITAPQRQTKTVSEVVNVAIDFTDYLDEGESLTGTPTAVEVTTAHLTIASVAVSTTVLTINKREVSIGDAVTMRVSGGQAGNTYAIKVTVTTTAATAQTRIVTIYLAVVAD